jgi:hypothetical protein
MRAATPITDVLQVQPMDTATVRRGEAEVTGRVRFTRYMARSADVEIGFDDVGHTFRVARGEWEFVSASRRLPTLPTLPHSVITGVETDDGRRYPTAIRGADRWHALNEDGELATLDPDEIANWTRARIEQSR